MITTNNMTYVDTAMYVIQFMKYKEIKCIRHLIWISWSVSMFWGHDKLAVQLLEEVVQSFSPWRCDS